MAGYDPQVALPFWQRMAASSTNQTAEFLSDHPSDETRINNIQSKFLPEALRYYNGGTTTNKSAAKASSTKTIKISSKK